MPHHTKSSISFWSHTVVSDENPYTRPRKRLDRRRPACSVTTLWLRTTAVMDGRTPHSESLFTCRPEASSPRLSTRCRGQNKHSECLALRPPGETQLDALRAFGLATTTTKAKTFRPCFGFPPSLDDGRADDSPPSTRRVEQDNRL
jgi:hypothetical protein